MPNRAINPDDGLREQLRQLIRAHKGNLSAIAKAMGVSRQAATRRITVAKLTRVAASARLAASSFGPRNKEAGAKHDERRRREMLRAFAKTDSDEAARQALGMSRRSFYRAKAAFSISADVIADERLRYAAEHPAGRTDLL